MIDILLCLRPERAKRLQHILGEGWRVIPYEDSPDFVMKLQGLPIRHVLIEQEVSDKMYKYRRTPNENANRLMAYIHFKVNENGGEIMDLD